MSTPVPTTLVSEVKTLYQKALQSAVFRAFIRILRVAVAAGIASFFQSLIPALQSDPAIGGVPFLALVILFVDKFLRDHKVY